MSARAGAPPSPAVPSAEGRAAAGRMSGYDLLFLAAGGVIGSGWMFAGLEADKAAGPWAVGSWLIGGLVLVIVTAVMVEVSTKVPKTGGLIFLPLQTSGPLLATLVAAGVWVFYAVNPASESIGMVQNLAAWSCGRALFNFTTSQPTGAGIGLVVCFLLLITAVNLLGPRQFLTVNNWLTAFKIFVPVLVVVLLGCALLWPPAHPAHFPPAAGQQGCSLSPSHGTRPYGPGAMLSAVVGGGVAYAYLGFQGPLDFAGNVRGGGIGEAARLRRAVFGTVLGSILLYAALQFVVIYLRHHSTGSLDDALSIYPTFASAVVRPGWLASGVSGVISLDSVLSPAGTAMVFMYVLTREVAALSRAHLTHRGLQRSKNSVIRLPAGLLRRVFGDDRIDVYWRILITDLVISLIALFTTSGYWQVLQAVPTTMALLVYATPSVVLAALRRRTPALFPRWYALMAEASFAALAVVFVAATGSGVLWGMGALAVFCVFLFGLPVVLPMTPLAPWYDARAHVREFGKLKTSIPGQLGAVLGGYFAVLTLAEVIRSEWHRSAGRAWDTAGLTVVAVISVIAFHWLVRLSVRYMAANPPLLPEPLPQPADRGRATGTGS